MTILIVLLNVEKHKQHNVDHLVFIERILKIIEIFIFRVFLKNTAKHVHESALNDGHFFECILGLIIFTFRLNIYFLSKSDLRIKMSKVVGLC